jgi:5-methylcytosine-specific restriction endonuclease McrA
LGGKNKQRLLLEYRYNFHNDKFSKRKVKGNKRKKFKNQKHNVYDDLYYLGKEVRMAYNYSCAYCGRHGKLTSHHIFYKSKFPSLMYNIQNMICLCARCHQEVHKLNDV